MMRCDSIKTKGKENDLSKNKGKKTQYTIDHKNKRHHVFHSTCFTVHASWKQLIPNWFYFLVEERERKETKA